MKPMPPVTNLRNKLKDSVLYVVTGLEASGGRSTVDAARDALLGGTDIIQLREKTLKDGELLGSARELRRLTREAGALFIVNDRVDLALLTDADGVHVGQDDLPVASVRKLLGSGKIIGVSTHEAAQALRAVEEGADYIGVGPVFATPTKAGRPGVTLEYVRQVAGMKLRIPWFAIGGIDGKNLVSVLEAGATRVAVVRAVVGARDPRQAAKDLKRRLQNEE